MQTAEKIVDISPQARLKRLRREVNDLEENGGPEVEIVRKIWEIQSLEQGLIEAGCIEY